MLPFGDATQLPNRILKNGRSFNPSSKGSLFVWQASVLPLKSVNAELCFVKPVCPEFRNGQQNRGAHARTSQARE